MTVPHHPRVPQPPGDAPAEPDAIGVSMLLDFLTGSSIHDLVCRYKLPSSEAAEDKIRQLLLRHGYSAKINRGSTEPK